MPTGDQKKGPLRRLFSPASRLTPRGRARRRFNCGKQEEWDKRAETALDLLRAHRGDWAGGEGERLSIADFGAGNERLRPLLAAALGDAHEYHPYDLHPQQPTTQALDVSRGLPARQFDLAICLGLLEYLPSIPDLAHSLRGTCAVALVSYVTSDSPVAIDSAAREAHGWTTHLTAAELEAAFAGASFSMVGAAESDGRATRLWLWRRDD